MSLSIITFELGCQFAKLILMPRKLILLLVLLFSVLNSYFILFNSFAFAQDASPTAAPPTCDLCGWCNPETNPKPPNWDSCNKCLYKEDGTTRERTYYTVLGCLSTESNLFVKSILSIVFAVAGGIAFLAVLGGAATVLTSAGDPVRLQNGKDMITSALFGILLIVFSVFLLRIVGLDILRIPGFG